MTKIPSVELRCLVTGAASGIGQVVATQLAERGGRVLATDVVPEALEAWKAEGGWGDRVQVAHLDVCDAEAWRSAVASMDARWDGIDVLFNIAGYLNPGYAAELALEDVDRHFDINVKGVIYGTRLCAERMVRAGSGHVVNVASMAAFAPVPGLSLYTASKYAVRAFSLAAAVELAPSGVAVTVVCPDAVATPMLDKQRGVEAAAITFSGPRVLTAEEVATALTGRVLRDRPLEVALPRARKWMARVVDLVPELGLVAAPWFQRKGRAAQKQKKPR